MAKIWIDEEAGVGTVGFLVRIANEVKGGERYELRDRPPTTNQSREPRARGWCGTWNDVGTHGEGIWRVVKIAPNGRRQIEEVTDPAVIEAFLDEYGYPELLDECLPKSATA